MVLQLSYIASSISLTPSRHSSPSMFGLRQSFTRLSCGCASSSSSKAAAMSAPVRNFSSQLLQRAQPFTLGAAPNTARSSAWKAPGPSMISVRPRSQLAPRRTKYRKAHKGRVPVPTGGSLKGTTVQEGMYGIRLLAPARLSAKQLQSAETALKRKLKVIKGAQVFMRVFPDIPVCVKGNETRMGKGKGAFEFWACRAPIGRVIFEVGGPVEIRQEVAREALRIASAKLPVPTEFIVKGANPRLGNLTVPAAASRTSEASSTPSVAAPATLAVAPDASSIAV